MGNIKMSTINTQKDIEKNEEKIEKMELKFEDLTKKISDLDSKYSQQIEEAKRKGIVFITNPEMHKKAKELKKKIEALKEYKVKTEGLYKTKCEIIVYENEQVKSQIKHL